MVDEKGFRLNVGIVLANFENKLFWGRRCGQQDAWQFPQGGIQPHETPEQAMYRELYEEIGLAFNDVKILGQTQEWLYYYIPKHLQRRQQQSFCRGQKQRWFLLRLIKNEETICFHRTKTPEFSAWQWVNYWHPISQIVVFKKETYKKVLKEFAPLLTLT